MEWTQKQQKEISSAKRVLAEGEMVLDVTTGMGTVRRMGDTTKRNGALLVTDRRVIFFTKKIGGYEMRDHVYSMLTSVDYKKGVAFGNITIYAAGDNTHISMVPKQDVERVAQCIRSQMGSIKTHSATVTTSIPDQIKKLAELHSAGILTDEEFSAKKADLLAKM